MTDTFARPVVVLTHRVHPEILDLLGRVCEVVPNQDNDSLPASELRRRAADADALMAFMPDQIDADFLDGCPRLQVVAGALKGYDNIDVDACTARGIAVMNTPEANAVTTAEHAVALLMSLARNIPAADASVRSGHWSKSKFTGAELQGKQLGVVGLGRIGGIAAEKC